MKKFFFLIASILFLVQISKAQTEKGNQTLGLNLGYTYSKDDNFAINPYDNSSSTQNTKYTQFSIGPTYSYFIADKLDIGASLSYSSNLINYSGTDPNPLKDFTKMYGASLFARKYFMYKDKIGFRAGPYVAYYKQNQQTNYSSANSVYNLNSNSNLYSAGANLELVYYPAKHLGVSASIANLNYEHITTDNGSQGHSKQDNIDFSFVNQGLYLSVYYTFGG